MNRRKCPLQVEQLEPRLALAGYQVVHNFVQSDGIGPNTLVQSGSMLYGTASSGGTGGTGNYGTIFKVGTDGTGFTVLHDFTNTSADGQNPIGSLILSGSTLYGMTSSGGSSGYGTIFEINTDGTGFSVIHSFNGGGNGGYERPLGSLIQSGSTLYGLTQLNVVNQLGDTTGTDGELFQINTGGTGFSLLYSFGNNTLAGSLVLSGSTFYGVDQNGIFHIGTGGNDFGVVYSYFGGGGLTISGSMLYVETSAGGTAGDGSIYQVGLDGTGFTVLHNFSGGSSDGGHGVGSLIQSGSILYGMTEYGGSDDDGTMFQINTDGTNFSLLYSFGIFFSSGTVPDSSLIQSGSTLYGVTENGGASGGGIIFSIATSAATVPPPWQNPTKPLDVNNDGSVDALDALTIINQLNSFGAHALTNPPVAPNVPPPYVDVNGDGFLSALDALVVINYLNTPSGNTATVRAHLLGSPVHETVRQSLEPFWASGTDSSTTTTVPEQSTRVLNQTYTAASTTAVPQQISKPATVTLPDSEFLSGQTNNHSLYETVWKSLEPFWESD